MKLERNRVRCRFCREVKEGAILRSYNLNVCLDCFVSFFNKRVRSTIDKFKMIRKGDKVAVAVSGGKDSIAVAKALKENGYDITIFHADCGIREEDYSNRSREVVEEFARRENLRLVVVEYEKEIGLDLKVVARIARKGICGVCGMIKRYLFNREAKEYNVIVTGHNLDDEASSLLSSLIFWKEYVRRQWPLLEDEGSLKRKVKPLVLISEAETRLYCELLNLPYNSVSCPLRSEKYTLFKEFIYRLDEEMPGAVLNFFKGFLRRKKELFSTGEDVKLEPCERCGYMTGVEICSFCRLKERIERYIFESFK